MERNLQNKLQQFSATPPERVWEKIADAMNENAAFAEKLYQYKEQPPASAWDAIEQNLSQATPAPVVPFTTRFRKPLRYAAVASFLAVMLVVISLSMKKTEAGALQQGSETTVPAQDKEDLIRQTATEAASLPAATEKEKTREVAATHKKNNSAPTTNQNRPLATTRRTRPTVAGASVLPAAKQYVTFADGEGRIRKVSQKMEAVVRCAENDLRCKQRLQNLRRKMASTVVPSDFTGVLEMLRHLQ